MRVEGVGNGEPMAARKLQQAKSPVVGLSCSVPTDSACPVLVGIFSYLCVEVTLNNDEVFLWGFLDYTFYLFVEFFYFMIFVVCCLVRRPE